MLYLTSTILILVLQTTLTTITALEHFAAVPRDKYALQVLPRMETGPRRKMLGGFGIDPTWYIEVHPCAHSFRLDLSSRYRLTPKENTFWACAKMDSSAAWWSEEVGCVPIWTSVGEKTYFYDGKVSTLGHCFTFKPLGLGWTRDPNAWKHPCDVRFTATVSLWYDTWYGMTYDECKNKPNVGAWASQSAPCHVFPGPRIPDSENHNDQWKGKCFVLDKVPVFQSYVEVHPCDKFFLPDRSTLFSVIGPSTFAQCKDHGEAVAWTYLDPLGAASECAPISKQGQVMLLSDGEQVRLESGLCFKFNADKTPQYTKLPRDLEKVRVPYKHVCEGGFREDTSRWYSGLRALTFADCGKKENAVAWRVGGASKGGCFVFYWKRNTQNVRQGTKTGICYILDKVVPLGSVHPPPWIVTVHRPERQLLIASI